MAKQWLQPTRRIPAGGLLLLAMLVVVVSVQDGWAGQQPAMGALKNAEKMSETLKGKQEKDRGVQTPGERSRIPDSRSSRASESYAGRRDPFKLPPPPGAKGEEEGGITGPLPPGIRGLVIGQLKLEGIVRMDTSNKMIAVVTNYTKRAYFLRENEALYNGVVSRITPDAVYFRENVLDQFGRVSTREVLRRLSSAPGEGR